MRWRPAETRITVPEALRDTPPGGVAQGSARKDAAKDGVSNQEARTLPVNVGKDSQARALRILDALAKALEARGYPRDRRGRAHRGQAGPDRRHGAAGQGPPRAHRLASSLSKKSRPWEKIPTWDYVPNGRLSIHSEVYVWWRRDLRRRWSDGRRSSRLEDMLEDVLSRARRPGRRAGAAGGRGTGRTGTVGRSRERQRAERERQARIDAARDADIVAQAQSLDKAAAVRRLVAAARHLAGKGQDDATPELEAWLERASAVADALDPLGAGLRGMLDAHEAAAEEAGKPPPTPRWGG